MAERSSILAQPTPGTGGIRLVIHTICYRRVARDVDPFLARWPDIAGRYLNVFRRNLCGRDGYRKDHTDDEQYGERNKVPIHHNLLQMACMRRDQRFPQRIAAHTRSCK